VFARHHKKLIFGAYFSNRLMMFKKLFLVVFLAGWSGMAFSQDDSSEKKVRRGRPDIPGTFLIDVGFNFPSEKADFNTGMWGSRTLNLYYHYDKQLFNSKFSIHPGIGFGLERYKFNNGRTLGYSGVANDDTLRMVLVPGSRKSQLITNYLDVPIELRFSTNPDDPARSFRASIGFKAGVLMDSFTKLKYKEDGEIKKLKNKQDFNLNPFRYGVTLRIGAGNFNVWTYYSLTPLFEDGKGVGKQEINNFSMGLSLTGF
jgi:hypothetical protein